MKTNNYLYEEPLFQKKFEMTVSDELSGEKEFIKKGFYDVFDFIEGLVIPITIDFEVEFVDEEYGFILPDLTPEYNHFRIEIKKKDRAIRELLSSSDNEVFVVEKIDYNTLIEKIDFALDANFNDELSYEPSVSYALFKSLYVKTPLNVCELENGEIPVLDDCGFRTGYPIKIINDEVWAVGPNMVSFMAPIYLEVTHESGYFELDCRLPLSFGKESSENDDSLISEALEKLYKNGWKEVIYE